MTYFEIVLIAVGLAMDAFAVAMCKGIKMRPFSAKQTLLIALFFGGAQALMPLIGWFLGAQFEQYIVAFDHWLAFILLGFIGGKMIFEALKRDADECDCCEKKFDIVASWGDDGGCGTRYAFTLFVRLDGERGSRALFRGKRIDVGTYENFLFPRPFVRRRSVLVF